MKTLFAIVSIVAIALIVVIIGPILTIWSANTLFPSLNIPYTLETWCAVIILGAFFRANVSVKKKD